MKAILSHFGRRANVTAQNEPADLLYKSSNGAPTGTTSSSQPSYSSADNAGSGIGDMPVKTVDRSMAEDHKATSNHAWATKLKANGLRRRVSGSIKRQSDTATHPTTAASDASISNARPSHPPSSYRYPLQTEEGANGNVFRLGRKLSISTSRRNSSSSKDASPHIAEQATSFQFDQSASQPGSSSVSTGGMVHSPYLMMDASNSPQPKPAVSLTINTLAAASPSYNSGDISAMNSSDLATRLNELAVANADGLISDDEYRTLRQAVFNRMMQADTQSAFASTAAVLDSPTHAPHTAEYSHQASPANDLLSVGDAQSRSSLGHAVRPASSIRSGRSDRSSSFQNVTDLFRRGTGASKDMHRQTSQDSCSSHDQSLEHRLAPTRRDSAGISSQLSSNDGHSQRALSARTHQSSAAKSSSRLSTFGRLRAGSQTRRAQAETAARDMEESFSVERTTRSLRAVSVYDAGSADLSFRSTGYDRSPTSLRAEMAPSTMFGAEYADKSSAEIQAEIAVVQAEGNRMLGNFTLLEETWIAKSSGLEQDVVRAVQERVRDSHPQACIISLSVPDRHASTTRALRAAPPSSFRSPRKVSVGSSSQDAALQRVKSDLPDEAAAFEAELINIYTQKAAVVKRYQDRLAFLQSKHRSATIREGLK